MYRTNGGEIAALKRRLDALGDPACGRREGLYRLCLAGVYLKRRCNLFLIGESSRSMPAEELLLCCRETGEILRDMDIRRQVRAVSPESKIVLLCDENAEKDVAYSVKAAKQDGRIDAFFYASVSTSYLIAALDTL